MANITPRCWNCGSAEKWTEIASMEECRACGIACHYHGSGANQAYLDAEDRRHARQEAEQRQRWIEQGLIEETEW